jgi:hypothetical protein
VAIAVAQRGELQYRQRHGPDVEALRKPSLALALAAIADLVKARNYPPSPAFQHTFDPFERSIILAPVMRTHLKRAMGDTVGGLLVIALCGSAMMVAAPTAGLAASGFNCHRPGSGAHAPGGFGGEERVLRGGAEFERATGEEESNRYICSFAGGRPHLVGRKSGPEDTFPSLVVFAGTWAAVVSSVDGIEQGLEIINLAKGRTVYSRALVVVEKSRNNTHGGGHVGRLVLKRDGSAAWTEQQATGAYHVLARTASSTHLLDKTNTTRPYSLSLKGSTLTWLEHSGEARRATLH